MIGRRSSGDVDSAHERAARDLPPVPVPPFPPSPRETDARVREAVAGCELRRVREVVGMSQRALSDASGVPQSSISRYECGDGESLTARDLTGIECALGLGSGELAEWAAHAVEVARVISIMVANPGPEVDGWGPVPIDALRSLAAVACATAANMRGPTPGRSDPIGSARTSAPGRRLTSSTRAPAASPPVTMPVGDLRTLIVSELRSRHLTLGELHVRLLTDDRARTSRLGRSRLRCVVRGMVGRGVLGRAPTGDRSEARYHVVDEDDDA